MKKLKTYRLRFLIMLALLAVVAVGYFTAGGIGNFCGIGFESITLLCPLGALLAMIAERTAIPMAVISVAVVLLVCIVLGKVFCAWACPVHFLSRGRKKGDKGDKEGKGGKVASPCSACASPCGKAKGIKIDSRHGILAAALGSTLVFGFPVFCLVCPIGLTFATVLLVMRLFAFGDATWTVVAFPAIIALEILLLPKWCQRFCPLGALLSLFSGLNRTFRPRWTPRSACARVAARPATCASRHAPRASTCTMSRRARPRSTTAASAARAPTCAPSAPSRSRCCRRSRRRRRRCPSTTRSRKGDRPCP